MRDHGTDVFVLLDTVAKPNVVSPQLVKSLRLKLETTSNDVTVAYGAKAKVLG